MFPIEAFKRNSQKYSSDVSLQIQMSYGCSLRNYELESGFFKFPVLSWVIMLVQGSTSAVRLLVQVTVHSSMYVCTCFSNMVVLNFCILRFVSVQVTTPSYQAIFPTWKRPRGPRNVFQSVTNKWLACESFSLISFNRHLIYTLQFLTGRWNIEAFMPMITSSSVFYHFLVRILQLDLLLLKERMPQSPLVHFLLLWGST